LIKAIEEAYRARNIGRATAAGRAMQLTAARNMLELIEKDFWWARTRQAPTGWSD
jgi:hypothetical protein